jgi:UDP-glucose 4-epimerase
MRLLVTGGLGYIGSHTTAVLAASGHEVQVLDNLSRTRRTVVFGLERLLDSKVTFHCVDVRNSNEVNRIFADQGFDAVIHFAALKSVVESVERPLAYFDNNVNGTIQLLEAMQRHGCESMIFSSSCTVYGQPDIVPVTEDSPIKPATSPYGATKQICERMLSDATRAGGLRAISLRYFNPIGVHPSGEIGELMVDGPSNLVPFIARSAAGASGPLPIFGTDYPTPDGTAIRDYIDIMDLARAHESALHRLLSRTGEDFECLNVGTGRGRSVREVVSAFEKTNAIPVPLQLMPRRPGDVAEVWANTSRAEMLLGWKATRTLEDSLRTVWKWQQSNESTENSNS